MIRVVLDGYIQLIAEEGKILKDTRTGTLHPIVVVKEENESKIKEVNR